MNCLPSKPTARLSACRRRRGREGTALIVVLVLLSVVGALLASNIVTLRRLRVELQLLEARQIRALAERVSPPQTNTASTASKPPEPRPARP